MPDPLISTIIPVLNGEPFLERCFSTLDAQTYPNLEIIFVDNGSTDSSVKMIKNYCSKKLKSRFILCKQKGPAAARNIGLQFADGDFLSFLDVDDEIHPNKHTILIKELMKYPNAGMALGLTERLYSKTKSHPINLGTLIPGLNRYPEPGFLWLTHIQHQPHIGSLLIKKNILSNVCGFPENLLYGEDGAFMIKIGLIENLVLVDQVVYTYHRHDTSLISKANQTISPRERYFQFYEKFALPYFYNRRKYEPFKSAFIISENIAFKILIRLIKDESKQKYLESLNRQQAYYKSGRYQKTRYNLFSKLPFKYANYLYSRSTELFSFSLDEK